MSAVSREEFSVSDPTDLSTGVHHAMAFGFRYDAANRVLRPVTKRLTIFENGASSPARDRWINAGYAPSAPDPDNNDVTNSAACGALSEVHRTIILSIAIKPPPSVRLLPSGAVVNADTATPAFPRGGGIVVPDAGTASGVSRAMFDAMLRAAQLTLTTMGMGSGPGPCKTQPPRFLPRDADVFWPVSTTIIVEPNTTGKAKTNVMRFDFADQIGGIAAPGGIQGARDGDYAVLDVDVFVNCARIELLENDTEFRGIDDREIGKVDGWVASFGGVDRDDFAKMNDDIKLAVSLTRRVRCSSGKAKLAVDDAVERFTRELLRIEHDRYDPPVAPVHKSTHPYR